MKNNLKDYLFHLFVKFFIKKKLPVNIDTLSEYTHANRSVSNAVDEWITEDNYKNSIFQYGIPKKIKDRINLKTNKNINYTDLILHYAGQYKVVNYLEIGVSVGKNFLPIIKNMNAMNIVGFDIEKINPVIEESLELIDEVKWQTDKNSIKTEESYFRRYKFNDKIISYISGDVYDGNSWEMLKSNKFNVIFSDAFHSPEAIQSEMLSLLEHKLIADDFVIIWDDMEEHMEYAFWKIYKLLKPKYRLNLSNICITRINGWLGEHEEKHSIGIISNSSLK